ncbi:MAG: hypothetical protein J6K75_01535 [Erysipelotrichaceae bacterium]|nr:hypothetical protein [Erysipelotrichaceae bacterium]
MLKEIEELRRYCQWKVKSTNILCISIIVITAVLELGSKTALKHSLTPIFVIAGLLMMLITSQRQSSIYIDEFRSSFLTHLFDQRIQLTYIEYGKGIDRFDLQKWGIIEGSDGFSSRDLIEGTCKESVFKMSFVSAYKNHEIYGLRAGVPQHMTIFSGMYFMKKLTEPTHGKVVASGDSISALIVDESERCFDSMFKVRCEECQEEVVLTDELKTKMMKIQRKHPDVVFGIVDGWLHLAIPRYTSIAAPSLSSPVNPELIGRMEKQMKEINDLILEVCE